MSFCEKLREFFKNLSIKKSCISTCCVDTIIIERAHHHKHHHKHHCKKTIEEPKSPEEIKTEGRTEEDGKDGG